MKSWNCEKVKASATNKIRLFCKNPPVCCTFVANVFSLPNLSSMTANTDQNLVSATKPQLLAFVQGIIGYPIDAYAIVAVLETYGLRDVDAQERFGADNVFALAEELFIEFRQRAKRYPYIPTSQEIKRLPGWQRFLLYYVRGIVSNAPWALQITSLLLFGYAFGVYAKFDGKQVTVAGVGMMLSFLVSGGFVQALGRMASFYNGQHSYALTRQVYYRLWTFGVVAMVMSAFALDGLNWFVPLFPEESLMIGLAYYVCCGVMSLSLTLFYTLNKHAGLFGSTLAGVVVMAIVMEYTPLSIYVAHWMGFLVTSAVGFVWIHRILKKLTDTISKQQRSVELPRLVALLPSIAPYFLAGMLYFAFLLTDRLVSWSLTPEGIFLKLWIHAGYEILLLWAFAAFSLILPLLEYIGDDFGTMLGRTQAQFGIGSRAEHNATFIDRYLRYWLMLVGTAVVVGLCIYALYSITRDATGNALLYRSFSSPALARQVVACGIIGYSVLVLGLMNNIILYTLSRPRKVIQAFLWAIIGNAALGFWLTRSFGYWYSVVGMTFGAFIFAALTTRAVMQALREMDYSCYAA